MKNIFCNRLFRNYQKICFYISAFLRVCLFSFTFFLLSFSFYAQDLHLSQYESSPQYLNPAMTGMFNGDYRINAHHRSQWRSIATKPFNTSALSFDMPYKKIKAGAFILNNRAGAGSYNVLNFVLSAAYDYSFKKNPHHHIAAGIQAGVIHKSVNMEKLYFSTQYNSSNGGGFNTDISSGEIFSNASIILPEANIGLMYFHSDVRKKINPFLGFSAFHLTEPNESFFGVVNKLPRRYLLHAGARINISEKLYLLMHSLAMQQTNDRETVNTFLANYYLKSSDVLLLAGATYRSRDAVIAHTGIKYGHYTYRFSYDINTSSLSAISNGKGGFELSVIYIIKKPIPNPVVSCPRI
jgi:type IX secretion system PorP/SprF family membrane protein